MRQRATKGKRLGPGRKNNTFHVYNYDVFFVRLLYFKRIINVLLARTILPGVRSLSSEHTKHPRRDLLIYDCAWCIKYFGSSRLHFSVRLTFRKLFLLLPLFVLAFSFPACLLSARRKPRTVSSCVLFGAKAR